MSDPAQIKRLKRIRREMLMFLEANRSTPWTRAQWLFDRIEEIGDARTDDGGGLDKSEFLRLMQDLENLELVSTHDARKYKHERRGVENIDLRITAKGTGLLAEAEPVCTLVEDARI